MLSVFSLPPSLHAFARFVCALIAISHRVSYIIIQNIFTRPVFNTHCSGVAGMKQMEQLIRIYRSLLKVTFRYCFMAELFPEA